MSHESNAILPTFDGQAPVLLVELPVLNGCSTIHAGGRVRPNALIDSEFYQELSRYRWGLINNADPGKPPRRYLRRFQQKNHKRTSVSLHRHVMALAGYNLPDFSRADHRNRDTMDNRLDNLRPATPSQNAMNTKVRDDGMFRLKGVYFRNNRWRARITKEGQNYELGLFDSKEDAARAYNRAANELFGEFASINEGIPEAGGTLLVKITLADPSAAFRRTEEGLEVTFAVPDSTPMESAALLKPGAKPRHFYIGEKGSVSTG